MSEGLANLQKGDRERAYDEEAEEDTLMKIPDFLDIDKFNRGRSFFKRNLGQCLLAMVMSLICGMSINRLLNVLVCTGISSTPSSSFKRYMSTFQHVLKWHYGNVWDPSSSASKSIRSVRRQHACARKFMHSNMNKESKSSCNEQEKGSYGTPHTYLSQYEMGLVQGGFMGFIVVYPNKFGIRCSITELDDYVYFWRCIGYLLGIKDQYNICFDGYEKANGIWHAMEQEILTPSLYNPPTQFYPMTESFLNGFKLYPVASTKSIIATCFCFAHLRCPFSVPITDRIRVYFAKGFFIVLYYFPSFANIFNRGIERLLQCQRYT